jgi:uncharacterized iron-regulated membrane protein
MGGRLPGVAGDVVPDMTVLVNPYTGNILPRSTGVSRFFTQLERVHRSMWAGSGPFGMILRVTLAYSVLMLIYMALSGLYLRWPKGRAVRDWRTWFQINFKLKGAAFLLRLHAVIGTFVFLIYLMSAHTGLMIGKQIAWYQAGVTSIREALHLSGLPRPPMNPSHIAPERLDPVWHAFLQHAPQYRVARIELPPEADGPVIIRSGTEQLSFDSQTGALLKSEPIPDTDATANVPEIAGGEGQLTEPLFEAFLNGNPYVHNGQRWGILGEFIMMCAGLCMPVMFITGWMMYAKRVSRRRRAQAEAIAVGN